MSIECKHGPPGKAVTWVVWRRKEQGKLLQVIAQTAHYAKQKGEAFFHVHSSELCAQVLANPEGEPLELDR